MRKALFTLLFLGLIPAVVFAQTLRIAVAANAQFVAKKLQIEFKKETGMETELVIGSSGKFTAQIKAGAPFDVFLSADTQYPDALYQDGLTLNKPKVYAYGRLVFWSVKKTTMLPYLAEDSKEKIAVANPKTAPYGLAAVSVLNKTGMMEMINSRLVYGESIAQVTQYMQSGAVDAAFTAKAVVLDPAMKNKGHWLDIDTKLYPPIAQSAVILKSTKNEAAAKKFYTFLYGKKARAIFKKYGYGL